MLPVLTNQILFAIDQARNGPFRAHRPTIKIVQNERGIQIQRIHMSPMLAKIIRDWSIAP
jgi:hypothetical protein